MERFFSKIMKKSKITSFIELGRPWNGISVILLSILGFTLTSTVVNLWSISVLSIVVFLIYTGSSALNDLFDIRVDSVNMPFRPLERGSLKVNYASYFCLACYLLGNVIALFISIEFFISILLMSISSIVYSIPPISLKDRLFMGNLNLGFASAFTTVYAGYVIATNSLIMTNEILFQALSLMLLFSFFSILKDFKDRGGDDIYNKKTIATKYGIKNASKINIIGTLIFFPLTIITFYYLSFQNLLFVSLSSLLFLAVLIPEIRVFKNPTQRMGEMSWGFGRIAFLFFLLSLFLF